MTAWLVAFVLAAGPGGKVVLVAGGGEGGDGGKAAEASLNQPFAVDFDRDGNMFIAEFKGHRVRKVDTNGVISTFAGTGEKGDGGDGGPALKATFNGMHHLGFTPNGDLYIADTFNNRVRRIDAKSGVIMTVAGTGKKAFGGDGGPGAKAAFSGTFCIAFDPMSGRMVVADLGNRRVRAVDLKTGTVTTVAGNGKKGVPADGAVAVEAPLVDPRAVATDSKGNIYILERGGHALRVVGPDGRIRTVAGTGKKGFGGDGGDALKAQLNGPKHLACDREDNVIIVDTENHVLRMYVPATGKIVRVAGTGKKGPGGVGGPPERLEMSRPHGVTVHPSGDLYVSDSSNGRVLKIAPTRRRSK